MLIDCAELNAKPGASNAGMSLTRVDSGPEKAQVALASWNLAGVSTKDIQSIFAHVIDCDVVAVQEFPKKVAGWKTITGERFHGITHQNYSMYRGVGVLYRGDRFRLLQKTSAARGVWVKLQHIQTQQQMCVGSVHLPNNEAKEEVARLLDEFLRVKPKGVQLAVVLGNFNVQFSWREENQKVVPGVVSAKWVALRQGMVQAGLQQVMPSLQQMNTATFHSRKGAVASTQIDEAFVTGPGGPRLHIQVNSRHEIGTDHDRVEMVVGLAGKGRPEKEGAKVGRAAEAWKKCRSELRKEKETWRESRLEKASSDWGVYKAIAKPRKQWGEVYMAHAEADNVVEQIKEHFEGVFHSEQDEKEMSMMEGLLDSLGGQGQERVFTLDEVASAIAKGKRGKAVGPDGVPTELLQALAKDPGTLKAMTTFFNGILSSDQIPRWGRSVTSLLPKVLPPPPPRPRLKDLRPIALASHVSKCFARLILARIESVLQVRGSQQFAAKGRQPAEFLWTSLQVMNLVKEWKKDAYMLKLDIRKAFDTVSRFRLAQKIVQWADGSFPSEIRCLLRMLMSREVVLSLPWGDHAINANTGVKQGATESALLFAKLLDDILGSISQEHVGPVLEEIPVD